LRRRQAIAAYAVLLATCLAGVFHAPWWAACAGACTLTLMQLFEQRPGTVPQLRAVSETVQILASVLNAAAAASGAFVLGYIARWMWGL